MDEYDLNEKLVVCVLSAGETNTISDEAITARMVCGDIALQDPDAHSGGLSVQCADGSVTVTGTVTRSVLCNILLVEGTLAAHREYTGGYSLNDYEFINGTAVLKRR